jgi:FkbM family methyltransferase
MNSLYQEKSTKLWCRENTYDELVIKEQKDYASFFRNINGLVVLDIGGNIGSSAYYMLKYGAKQIISYEPDSDNIELYKKNIQGTILKEGAVSNKEGFTIFYKSGGKNKGLGSIIKVNGRETMEVQTFDFNKEIDFYKPEAVKCDIEGGEYNFDWNNTSLYSIKYIAMELHPSDKLDGLYKLIKQNYILLTDKEMKVYGKTVRTIVGERK